MGNMRQEQHQQQQQKTRKQSGGFETEHVLTTQFFLEC